MAIIDGVDVAIWKCDCGNETMLIFKGNEGFKIACSKCHKDQRELLAEMKLPYLWRDLEATL
jgi:hypothetical protein